MITVDTLRTKISNHLSNVRPIEPGIIRGEKSDSDGHPYAVYYFALSNDLTDWANHLEERQDEILGPSYFQSEGDLRWNHYLYLLASKEAASQETFRGIKQKIERNASYARKFVFSEDELPDVLKELEPAKTIQREIGHIDVVGRWSSRLLQNGLGIVLDQRPLAETVREISRGTDSSPAAAVGADTSPRLAQPLATQFLDSLEIERFREWPKNIDLSTLGTVNLIVGANGVGKTTLLEAIEYFYCIDNARTPAPLQACIKAKLKGASSWIEARESPSPSRIAESKQRNLDWYGQRDLKGSTLHNSFARFNFLSTDEATLRGQKGAEVPFEDMLSRVVSGPKAAELWDHISRLIPPLEAEESRLLGTIDDKRKIKASFEERIKIAAAAPRASDSELSALAEDLSRLGFMKANIVFALTQATTVSRDMWTSMLYRDKWVSKLYSECIPDLNRTSSIIRELLASKLDLANITRGAVAKARQTAEDNSARVEHLLAQLSEFESILSRISATKQALAQTIQTIELIRAAQQLDAFSLAEDHDRLLQDIANLRSAIGNTNLPREAPAWLQELKEPLKDDVKAIEQDMAKVADEITNFERQLSLRKESQTRMTSMLTEIRALARQLIRHSPNHTDCPVCATKFEIGKLEQRLNQVEAGNTFDDSGQLLEAIISRREKISELENRQRILLDLIRYSKCRFPERQDLTTQEILQDYFTQQGNVDRLQKRLDEASKQLAQLSLSGFNYESITQMRQSASSLSIDLFHQGAVDDELARKNNELQSLDSKFNECAVEQRTLHSNIFMTIGSVDNRTDQLYDAVKSYRNRLALLRNAETRIAELQQFIELEDETSIATIAPLLDSAKASAERLANALLHKEMMQKDEIVTKKHLTEVESEIKQNEDAQQRIRHAINVLLSLREEDSLLAATEAELLDMKEATDYVFRRIHSPHEYGVRRDMKAPLHRLGDETTALTLRDISTGQRAAFVLSVFLAMNAKLKSAPPVLLFDDPVAHIDDFNVLSFLDHLRDVALEGKRQIFYATADSRLAGLFEHKFSFMGDGFRRFDLER